MSLSAGKTAPRDFEVFAGNPITVSSLQCVLVSSRSSVLARQLLLVGFS
jgi:hypothetical protein